MMDGAWLNCMDVTLCVVSYFCIIVLLPSNKTSCPRWVSGYVGNHWEKENDLLLACF